MFHNPIGGRETEWRVTCPLTFDNSCSLPSFGNTRNFGYGCGSASGKNFKQRVYSICGVTCHFDMWETHLKFDWSNLRSKIEKRRLVNHDAVSLTGRLSQTSIPYVLARRSGIRELNKTSIELYFGREGINSVSFKLPIHPEVYLPIIFRYLPGRLEGFGQQTQIACLYAHS